MNVSVLQLMLGRGGDGKRKMGRKKLTILMRKQEIAGITTPGTQLAMLASTAVSALVSSYMLQVNMDTVSDTPQALVGHLVT